jgi:hypothetical protein
MKVLKQHESEMLALTKHTGVAEFLDGNRVYVKVDQPIKTKTHILTSYGFIDIEVSRKDIWPIEYSEYPHPPRKIIVKVNKGVVEFATWLLYVASLRSEKFQYPQDVLDHAHKTIAEIKLCDFNNMKCATARLEENGINEGLMREAEDTYSRLTSICEEQAESNYHPWDELDAETTSAILHLLDFDKDKKEFVSYLKTSFGAELKDNEVKFEKFGKFAISGFNLEQITG